MSWNVHQEFVVIDDLLVSASRSKGVDAFALSLLKAERHARRIFTYLIFQNECFGEKDVSNLREALGRHRHFDFSSAIAGIDLISPYALTGLCGHEHSTLLMLLPTFKRRRGKIFHGQLTHESLTTTELVDMAIVLRNWCFSLAEHGATRLGYDGFSTGSFVKHANPEFSSSLRRKLTSVSDYSAFIEESHTTGRAK